MLAASTSFGGGRMTRNETYTLNSTFRTKNSSYASREENPLTVHHYDLVISSFYEKYHHTESTTKDFTDLWEKVTKVKGLKKFFDDWIYTANYTALIKNRSTIRNRKVLCKIRLPQTQYLQKKLH
ncbi:MAG: hypothetical protein LBJ63_08950 [Prevotellaceae bacterium]|jgi:hypothetical protein|nr:hypothetical protein [Prevotellaceae bacterium]